MDWKTSFLLDLTRHWISLSGRWFRWISDPSVRSSSHLLLSMLNRFGWEYFSSKKKIVKDNIEWCADIFKKCVLVDQSIDLGDTVIRKYTPARQNQAQCIISFYCSESDKPIYVVETGGRKIAKDPSCHARTFHGCLSARYVGLGYVHRRAALRSTARDSNSDGLCWYGDQSQRLGRDHGEMSWSDEWFSQQIIRRKSLISSSHQSLCVSLFTLVASFFVVFIITCSVVRMDSYLIDDGKSPAHWQHLFSVELLSVVRWRYSDELQMVDKEKER